jgi:sugar phosphate isomerase/epimerase
MQESKKQILRKDFLQMTAMGTIGSAIIPSSFLQSCADNKLTTALPSIALQLYTLRNEIEKDIAGTLKRVAELGFKSVETAFWPKGISVKQAAGYLKAAGLTVSSAHIELPVGDNKALFLETAEALGCKKMIWHGWPEDKRYSTADGTKELIAVYNEANHFAKSNGLQFGLHNHWWEYRNKIGDRYVYELLLESVDPDIFFEIDTYWVKVAGHDPAKIVGTFGNRAPLLHIKDGPAKWNDSLPEDNPDPMTAVGKGTQDFPAIARAANGNTEYMVVEMDVTATDVFEALRESYDYLIKNKLAKG